MKHNEQLASNAASLGLSICFNPPEDGNCLWRIFTRTSGETRKTLVAYMREKAEALEIEIKLDRSRYETVKDYFAYLDGDGHFADDLCIEAHAEKTRIGALIVSSLVSSEPVGIGSGPVGLYLGHRATDTSLVAHHWLQLDKQ